MNKVKPTDKQKRFIKLKTENPRLSNTQAAIQAGYSEATAVNARRDILEKPGVKQFLALLAPDDKIAKTINEGLDAYKRDHYSGEFEPDFAERRQTAKLLTELKGYKSEQTTNQLNIGEMSIRFVERTDA